MQQRTHPYTTPYSWQITNFNYFMPTHEDTWKLLGYNSVGPFFNLSWYCRSF